MSSITLWGAVYDTDHVDLPKTGGGTARFSEGGGGGGYTRTVIVPEQTVPASGNQWALIASDANLIEGNEYIVTVNGAEKISTATKNGSIVYISFIDWDWNSSGYAFGTEPPYSGVYFRAITDGNYTVKVEKLELTGSGGGGGSAWTKVAETTYQVKTTSTSTATVATWATGSSELWTDDKWVYIRIRDTAGKRAGYFYGSDNFFLVPSSGTSTNLGVRFCERYTSSGTHALSAASSTTGYGVYADTLYSDGRVRIRAKYDNTNSLTINGTYKVEVYLLDPPTGAPIFT